MNPDFPTVPAPRRAPTAAARRFRLHRAGIRNVWQYDEQDFAFGDGRLLLRGKNGAGKSKALEMLLPYLLDGDARALDATGTGRTTLVWLMLDGVEQTNRTGYLWVEFRRPADEAGAGEEFLTLGAAIRASKSTGRAVPAFFVTPLRVGEDLHLVERGQPLPVEKLKERVGAENVTERAVEHRARVARELFGITDTTRFRNLTQLLHRLRRPTVGDRVESGGLVTLLSETLPGLDDEVVEKVARNLHDLDAVRNELGRLERTDAALRTFLDDYRGYLSGVLRRASQAVLGELDVLAEWRRKAGNAAKEVSALRRAEEQAAQRLADISEEREAAQDELAGLQSSDGYRSVQELSERRTTVRALHTAATTSYSALLNAHRAERGAAEQLAGELRQSAERLKDITADHRELLSDAERAGLSAAHVGEAVSPRQVELDGPRTFEVPDPDGGHHVVRHERVAALDTVATSAALDAWHRQLEAGRSVAANRSRAAAEVQRLFAAARKALTEAAAADAERERYEQDLQEATAGLETARTRVVAESASYGQEVAAWAEHLDAALAPGCPDLGGILALASVDPAPDAPFADRTLPAEIDAQAAEAAHLVLASCAGRLSGERDRLAVEVRQLRATLDSLADQRREWERLSDPTPPPPPHRRAPRQEGTGAPFYRLVDFADGLSDTRRAHLEAALQASGLLDAWVTADGAVLGADALDTLLDPRAVAVDGPSLTAALRPVEVTGTGVAVEQIERVLSSVSLAPGVDPRTTNAVYWDGSWRLGVLSGRSSKPAPEFVGAAVRAETRRRRLAELDTRIAEVSGRLSDVGEQLARVDLRRKALDDALRRFPPARRLAGAWTEAAGKAAAARELAGKVSSAARKADGARTAAVTARTTAEAAATANDLPVGTEDLARTAASLTVVLSGLGRLARTVHRASESLGDGREAGATYGSARDDRLSAEADYRSRMDELRPARTRLATLEEAVGSTEGEILAREEAATARIDAASRVLPAAQDAAERARDVLVRAEEKEKRLREDLAHQETAVITAGSALRGALGRTDVTGGAGLETASLPAEEADLPEADVRGRIRMLRQLADAVRAGLGRPTHDVSDSTLMNRYTTLRDALAGGFDAQLLEKDGIKVCRLLDDHGSHDVAVVGLRIAGQAEDARGRLTQRESDVFQRFLTGELGDHLSEQVIAAAGLVAALNDTLRTVRTSHGLGVELRWKLHEDVDADVRAAVELLRSPSGLRTREQTEQLREVLQRRIEEARRADPAAGYAAHLRTALDYRGWFRFHAFVVEDARPGRRRPLTGRTGLSQGEQRVLSYLVLFAAAASHFTTLGESAPHAPRLILLDDAFAKVDEPTHARLGRILVDLDLDFVLTSERLMGNWADVPSLHIYECLRDPHVRGVATLHYTWNGRNRRLVSV
ncbi:MAG: TIGR02680 family protein [Streptomyces sp.]|nr:TIGR02680 family protein [Streptomyces sp.]